jgi:hypothetical protein
VTRLTPAPQRWPRPHVRWILVREYGDGTLGVSVHSNTLFRTRTEAREHAGLDEPMILHAVKVEVPRRWRLSSAWGRG